MYVIHGICVESSSNLFSSSLFWLEPNVCSTAKGCSIIYFSFGRKKLYQVTTLFCFLCYTYLSWAFFSSSFVRTRNIIINASMRHSVLVSSSKIIMTKENDGNRLAGVAGCRGGRGERQKWYSNILLSFIDSIRLSDLFFPFLNGIIASFNSLMIVDVRNCINNSFLSRNCVCMCVYYVLSALFFPVFIFLFIFFDTVVNERIKRVASEDNIFHTYSFFFPVTYTKFYANFYQNWKKKENSCGNIDRTY